MRKLSRESWIAIGLFALLALVTAVAAVQEGRRQTEPPALSSLSTAPNGAQALWLWLDELGYRVSNEVSDVFQIPEDTSLVLMLEPSEPIRVEEWTEIDDWVEGGGTLLLAGDQWGMAFAARHYDFELTYLEQPASSLSAQTPLWTSPPLTSSVPVQAQACFETTRGDFIAHLAVGARPALASWAQGAGRVILSAAPFPLSNAGLKEAGNPPLVLNLVAPAGRNGAVWLDEWHHGVRPPRATAAGPGDWLRYTPAGQALLYVAAVVFLVLLLQGRRFGRPVPLARSTARRAPLEYVTAMANLSRQAGHRQAALRQYRQRLKRELGKRYRINPTLPDEEYVTRLSECNPHLDAEALHSLLARLDRDAVSEGEMVQLAAEAAQWLEEMG